MTVILPHFPILIHDSLLIFLKDTTATATTLDTVRDGVLHKILESSHVI